MKPRVEEVEEVEVEEVEEIEENFGHDQIPLNLRITGLGVARMRYKRPEEHPVVGEGWPKLAESSK